MKRYHDTESLRVLSALFDSHDREGTRVDREHCGGYRAKTVDCGELMDVMLYPLADTVSYRAACEQLKRAKRDPGQRLRFARYNNRRRCREFEWLVNTNMRPGDLHVVCTYAQEDFDSKQESKPRDEAVREINNYLSRVKYLLKKHGVDVKRDFVWIRVTVTKEHDNDLPTRKPTRHHHHILMHGVPEELRRDVEKLWKHGYCNADRLQDSKAGFSAVAGYVARQEGSHNGENAGRRSFTCSRNVKRPRITTNDSKISRLRAERIAADVLASRELVEKAFSGCMLIEAPTVSYSDFIPGPYIRIRLRRRYKTQKGLNVWR